MVTLILLLLVMWLALVGLLVVWTVFFQGYIYTEPVQGIVWRGPVAGSVVGLFLAIWVLCDYKWPERYRTLLDFNSQVDLPPYPEFRIVNQEGNEEVFKQAKNEKGRLIYRQDGRLDGREPPTRPQKVIVTENGADVIFEPDRDPKTNQFKVATGLSLYYRDKKGRKMKEGELGEITESRAGNFLANLLINFLHLLVWFVVLWLLLEYRMWHALGMALVAWVALTLFVLPPTLNMAEAIAQQARPAEFAFGPFWSAAVLCSAALQKGPKANSAYHFTTPPPQSGLANWAFHVCQVFSSSLTFSACLSV